MFQIAVETYLIGHKRARLKLPKPAQFLLQADNDHVLIDCLLTGILALTGSIEFFVKKFTVKELDFSAGSFVAHIAGWMFFISGCCGYCHGYGYRDDDDTDSTNQVYPLNMPGGFFGGFGVDRLSRFAPMNFARKKWRDMQSNRTSDISVA